MPEDLKLTSMSQILTYEEICSVAALAVDLGIVHFRLTGGEPLVRRGVESLVSMLKGIPGVQSVTMTTNGVELAAYAGKLKSAGLDGINVSLDTVDREEYASHTGRDLLPQVLEGIQAAKEAGLFVKLNGVAGETKDMDALIAYANEQGLVLRFIEMMPIGWGRQYTGEAAAHLPEKLEERYGKGTRRKDLLGTGPAIYYDFPKLDQPVGLIRAIHGTFCSGCNRVRLTAEGRLKLCLCYEDGLDLREMLRATLEAEEIKAHMKEAIFQKPSAHCFQEPRGMTEEKAMVKIGG
jgi:cyclic pyranopterin phosphate synthase